MNPPQPIRLPPDDGRSARPQRQGEYTVPEKAVIARLAVTAGARVECPRCEGHLQLIGVPAAGENVADVVWDFQCPGCRRRVLLTHIPSNVARAS